MGCGSGLGLLVGTSCLFLQEFEGHTLGMLASWGALPGYTGFSHVAPFPIQLHPVMATLVFCS